MYNTLGPQVVVVDDKYDEVKGIVEGLRSKGIGCEYLNPDPIEGNDKPSSPFNNVSLLFMDLYFSEIVGSSYDEYNVASWIKSIVGKNSFYVLVVWSTDKNASDKLIKILDELSIKPITVLIKGKTEQTYIDSSTGQVLFDKLIDDVENEIEQQNSISELILWKQSILSAINNVISTINTKSSKIDVNLKKIITAHGGKVISSKSEVDKREALQSAMDEVLLSRSKHFRVKKDIDEKAKAFFGDLNTDKGVDSELNNWFIFERADFGELDIKPGLIFKSQNDELSKFAISNSDLYPKLSGKGGKPLVFDDIYMIINPSCNISQNNLGAGYKILSGIVVESLSNSFKKVSDSIKYIESIKLNGFDDGILLFDVRYVFTIPESEFMSFEISSLAQLAKSTFNDIQIFYTSYSSRIGYTKLV